MGKVDVVQLGSGITADSLTLERDGDDLVLNSRFTSDTLRVKSYFALDAAGGHQIEQIKFYSGSIWNVATVKSMLAGQGGTSGDDTITGSSTADILNGLDGNDVLYGMNGNDVLRGGAGNDRLDGGTGIDTMLGGVGNDSYVVDNAADVVTELTGGGIDTVESLVTFVLGTEVENLKLTGTAAITGTGNSLANSLIGNAAANTLSGGSGNDTLDGGAGADTMDSGAGSDSLIGGTGNDTYRFASGDGLDVIDDADIGGSLDAIVFDAGSLRERSL